MSDPIPTYAFSKHLNLLEFDPSYPKNPKTSGDYIRKWRMEQGISQVELAEKLGVDEMTIVNWEVKDMTPCSRHLEKLRRLTPGLSSVAKDSY